jgi:hypothetical protein
MKAGRLIYKALGVPDNMGFTGSGNHNHCQFPSNQQADLTAFINKFLLNQNANTANIEKGPSGAASTANKSLPKPYPETNGLPKTAYPTDKKTAVRSGQPKPFTPPVEQKKPDPKKAYPGTNTLPGQSRTPVQQQKYKPLPKLGPQVGQGQTMQHIAI